MPEGIVCPSPKRFFHPVSIQSLSVFLPQNYIQVSTQFNFHSEVQPQAQQFCKPSGFHVLEETCQGQDQSFLELPSVIQRYHADGSLSMRQLN